MALKLYLGARFEHEHENKAAKDLAARLSSRFLNQGQQITAIFNFALPGRYQIDCLLLAPSCVYVVDFKKELRAFRACMNGRWRIIGDENRHVKGGESGNPYYQIDRIKWGMFHFMHDSASKFLSAENLAIMDYPTFKSIHRLIAFHPLLNQDTTVDDLLLRERAFKIANWEEIPDLLANAPAQLKNRFNKFLILSMQEMETFAEQVLNAMPTDPALTVKQSVQSSTQTSPIITDEKVSPVFLPNEVATPTLAAVVQPNPSPAQQQQLPTSPLVKQQPKTIYPIYILADASDSMNRHSRREKMIEALNMLIRRVGAYTPDLGAGNVANVSYEISVITFSDTAQYLFKRKPLEEITEITDLRCAGSTGLHKAFQLLLTDIGGHPSKGLIALITDGAPSAVPAPLLKRMKNGTVRKDHFLKWKDFREFLAHPAINACKRFAIGVGDRVCIPMIQAFAEGPNAIQVKSAEDIPNVATYIADNCIGEANLPQSKYGIENVIKD